jgi:hypothetical protein
MYSFTEVLRAFVIGLVYMFVSTGASLADEGSITAIDIALKPDATMLKHAQTANAQLRKVYPKSFALDASHHPHITLLQRYVHTADLGKVYLACEQILDKEKPGRWTLNAFKYYYLQAGAIGVAGIVIKPTQDLIRLQQELVEAVAPFTVPAGTAAAFVTTREEPDINQPTIDYVGSFLEKQLGKKYNPHVSTGVATIDYLEKLVAQPFDGFTFSPEAASVYQLGNFGTAQKELKSLKFQP